MTTRFLAEAIVACELIFYCQGTSIDPEFLDTYPDCGLSEGRRLSITYNHQSFIKISLSNK